MRRRVRLRRQSDDVRACGGNATATAGNTCISRPGCFFTGHANDGSKGCTTKPCSSSKGCAGQNPVRPSKVLGGNHIESLQLHPPPPAAPALWLDARPPARLISIFISILIPAYCGGHLRRLTVLIRPSACTAAHLWAVAVMQTREMLKRVVLRPKTATVALGLVSHGTLRRKSARWIAHRSETAREYCRR